MAKSQCFQAVVLFIFHRTVDNSIKKDMTLDFLKIVVTSSHFFFYKFVESLEESGFPAISHVDSTNLGLDVLLCQIF